MHFSNQVQKLSSRYSYREIGKLTGTSHAQVSRWTRSESEPTGLQQAILDAVCDRWDHDEDAVDILVQYAKQGEYDKLISDLSPKVEN